MMLALLIALLNGPVHPAVAEAKALLKAELDPKAPLPAGEAWPMRRQWAAARRAPCTERIQRIEALEPNGPGRDAETRLRWLLAAQIACKRPTADTRLQLALAHPDPTKTPAGLTPDQQRTRARSLEQQGDYAAARAIWQALGTPADRFEIARLGLKRFRTDFPGVAKQFKALAQGDDPLAIDAAYFHAKALGRAGQVPAAIAAYEALIQRHPTHKRAADAAFFKAFLMYEVARRPTTQAARKAEYLKAAQAFDGIEAKGWQRSARWYAAWARLLAGEPSVQAFEAVAADAKPGSALRRKALYWAAWTERFSHPVRATVRFARLLEERTFDWYGLLILRQFPALAPAAATLSLAPAPPPPALASEIKAIEALQAAKLGWFARARFATLRPALREAKRLDLEAALAVRVGDAEDTLRRATSRNQPVLRQPPRPADAAVWHAAYPLAYAALIRTHADRQTVPAALIHGFIRKESAYAPDAVSHAHAKGLMQLLPRTAKRIQADRGLKGKAVDLHDPATNIALGTWYVGALAARYGHQPPLTKAAFNAGPVAVESWRGAQAQMPLAQWVESIPFLQAREYVKRLSTTEVIYRMLLDGQSLAAAIDAVLPGQVDTALDRGGVSY